MKPVKKKIHSLRIKLSVKLLHWGCDLLPLPYRMIVMGKLVGLEEVFERVK